MILFYILLFALLLWRAEPVPRGQFHQKAFSQQSSLPLRGFFMLLILFHHLSQQLNAPGSLVFLQHIGPLCVSYFFFESGYGLMKSVLTKEDYFHHFFRKRYSKLLLPFFLCNLIYLCVNRAFGVSYSSLRILKCLTGMELVNTHAWFILTIMLFYLAFYFIFRFCNSCSLQYALLLVFQLLYAAYCMHKGSGLQLFEGPWWFNSSSPFFVGVLFGSFEGAVLPFIKKNYRLFMTLCVPVFLLFHIISVYVNGVFPYQTQDMSPLSPRMLRSWFNLVWQSLSVNAFCVMVLLASLKIKCSNPLLCFLGKISLELYLIHGLFIQLFKGQLCTVQNDWLFIFLVLFCSVLSAWLLHAPLHAVIPAAGPLPRPQTPLSQR